MPEERCMKVFLASINSEETKKVYIYNLERFRKFAKFDRYSDFTKMKKSKIQEIVEDYVMHLRETVNPNSVPPLYYPIQTFLEMNDILINFKKIRRFFPARVKTAVERGWTTEEVRRMLLVANESRSQALIHFENASGGRIGIFYGLKMEHLKEINDDGLGKCYAIIGYAGEREEYITFLTPEATISLDNYFEKRRADGETITSKSPVFREKYIIGSQPVKLVKASALGESVRRVIEKAGLRNKEEKKGNRYAIPANHGFRHRFDEIIKSVPGINAHYAEKMFAHTSRLIALDTIYNNPNIEKMFKEYRKIIPHITIDEAARKQTELDQKQKRIDELEERQKKIDWLEREVKVLMNTTASSEDPPQV